MLLHSAVARLWLTIGTALTDLPPPSGRAVRDVAFFLPFECNKRRQRRAKRGTRRKWESRPSSLMEVAIWQSQGKSSKGRLARRFPATNQEVAGSSPAGPANHLSSQSFTGVGSLSDCLDDLLVRTKKSTAPSDRIPPADLVHAVTFAILPFDDGWVHLPALGPTMRSNVTPSAARHSWSRSGRGVGGVSIGYALYLSATPYRNARKRALRARRVSRVEAKTVASKARGSAGRKASIGTSEDAKLVAQGEYLEQEISTRAQGGSKRRNRPQRVSHWLQNGRQRRRRQRFSAQTR